MRIAFEGAVRDPKQKVRVTFLIPFEVEISQQPVAGSFECGGSLRGAPPPDSIGIDLLEKDDVEKPGAERNADDRK